MSQPFLAMTELPPEIEKTLLRFPYSTLIKILRTKTKISGTDTNYTAVQWISREFSLKEVEKAVKTFEADLDKPETSRLYTAIDKPDTVDHGPSNVAIEKALKPKAAVAGNSHPQVVINAKTALAKAVGGNIQYSRADKGWLITKSNGTTTVWTSEQFRNIVEDDIQKLIQEA